MFGGRLFSLLGKKGKRTSSHMDRAVGSKEVDRERKCLSGLRKKKNFTRPISGEKYKAKKFDEQQLRNYMHRLGKGKRQIRASSPAREGLRRLPQVRRTLLLIGPERKENRLDSGN